MVILPFDPTERDAQGTLVNAARHGAFRKHYPVQRGVILYGGFTGSLDNGGERVQLQRPDDPPPGEPGYIPYLIVDEILFDDASPWSTEPDGSGKSLTRYLPAEFGHSPYSWAAAVPSPGSFQVILNTFKVADFAARPSGFFVQFNRAFDAGVLNLHDGANHSLGPADITLVGNSGGAVPGSLVFGTDSLTFVATRGPLPTDTYSFTLRSVEGGLQDLNGQLLDGDSNGTPGENFTGWFDIAPELLVVSLPHFSRGPGQPVNVPADGTGLPLILTDNRVGGGDVRSVELTIAYDPALLTITGAALGPNAPEGSSVTADTSISGQVTVSFTSPTTPLGTGDSYFVRLTAAVPWGATSARTACSTCPPSASPTSPADCWSRRRTMRSRPSPISAMPRATRPTAAWMRSEWPESAWGWTADSQPIRPPTRW